MYFRPIILFVVLLQNSWDTRAQDFIYQWGTSFGDVSFERARALVIDTSGNVYATGSFQRTADIVLPVGSASLTSYGGEDIFLMKVSPAGDLIWACNIGSTGSE